MKRTSTHVAACLLLTLTLFGCDDGSSPDPDVDDLQTIDTNDFVRGGKADVVDTDEFSLSRVDGGPALGDVFLILTADVECTTTSSKSHESTTVGRVIEIDRVFDENGVEIPLAEPMRAAVKTIKPLIFLGQSFNGCDALDEKLDNADVLIGFWNRCNQGCSGQADPEAEHVFETFYYSFE